MAELKGGSTVAGSLILTRESHAVSLSNHDDVNLTSITTGELLKWDGTDWVNQTIAEMNIATINGANIFSAINTFTNDVRLYDSDKLQLGTSQDLVIQHDGSNSSIFNNTGVMYVGTLTTDFLTFRTNNLTRWYIDGSSGNFMPGLDSTYDIGTTSVRVKKGYFDDLNVSGTITGSISGSATTLTTARTIALSGAATGTATSFNGSANITIPVTSLNAANLSGTVPNASISGTYTGLTSVTSTTFIGALTGNASTASSAAILTTARTIAGTSFNGSANIDISYANLTNKPSFYTSHTYAISGDVKVPSGATDYIVPFYIPVKSGTTVKLISARHSVYSGSCTVKLQKNGADITGFTSLSVTTTDTTTDPSDVSLADNDEIALVVTATSSAKNLSFTLIFEIGI